MRGFYNTDYYWENGAKDIKAAIGTHIDAVFCGSDYSGTNRFESLYCPESEVIYFDRREVPISSTEIRFDPYKQWDYLPPVCRPYYAKRVLIVGGESTGKSTPVQNLAMAYNTNYVSEVGRETCEAAGGEAFMNMDDLEENLIRQKAGEIAAARNCNRLFFVDTDALTTMFYSAFLLADKDQVSKCAALATAISALSKWDLVLFLEPTASFVQDGTRSETIAADRAKYSEQIRALFSSHGIPVVLCGGDYADRFDRAKQEIARRFSIDTVW